MCVCVVQRYKIVSAEVEPADEDCDWPSDPEDSLPVSRLPYYAPEMRTFRNCWTGTFTGNFSGPGRVLGSVCVCACMCVCMCVRVHLSCTIFQLQRVAKTDLNLPQPHMVPPMRVTPFKFR